MSARDGIPPDGHSYWRSLQELADSEESHRHLEAEFPTEAELPAGGLNRRRFLQLMSASIAMAGLAGCRWPEEKIVPFAHRAAGYDPGETKRFATTLEIAGAAAGLLVTSYDGRPIKVEGNPEHPFSRGAADVFAQASVLGLYDPDRSRQVLRHSAGGLIPAGWDEFTSFAAGHFESLKRRGGQGLAILGEATSSPGVAALKQRMLTDFPRMRWYNYEPCSRDSEREGAVMTYRQPVQTEVDLSRARVIVDLDANVLLNHPSALRNAQQFASRRDPAGDWMNRLYVFENSYSVTGAMADHHFPTPAVRVPAVTASLTAELFLGLGLPLPPGTEYLSQVLPSFRSPPGLAAVLGIAARDLLENQGQGLVVAGPRQPAVVHGLCNVMNAALDNLGHTVHLREDPEPKRPNHRQAIGNLAHRMARGQVDTLVILGGNPVYNSPGLLPQGNDFTRALRKVATSIHLSLYHDETSDACTWHLPRAHPLEAWGETRLPDGSLASIQPLIQPLYDGKTSAELLSLIVEQPGHTAHELARRAFHHEVGGRGEPPVDSNAFEKRWRRFLHLGWLQGSSQPTIKPEFRIPIAGPNLLKGLEEVFASTQQTLGPENLELVFAPDSKLHDGRFANNGWLQELPDPLTKMTWDNAAILGPATASELQVTDGDVITLHYRERKIDLPAYILPGQAPYSVTVNFGYGRTRAGRVGNAVGGDVNRLRDSAAFYGGPGLRISKTGRHHELACTQDHHAIDERGATEREMRAGVLIREADLATYREHPDFATHQGIHHPPLVSLWKEHEYKGHKWGMAIDLNTCIGCNACVVACQAENNIPVVGKEQVLNGREMHWLRLDRYFRGEPDDPQVGQQPVACVHCEMAPCEQVCPVAATTHSDEGLNTMVYNRCVGTRYCANNCPYKVRRFNFFNNQKGLTEVEQLVHNPEVTVRSRGVMEKCSYCTQRIEAGRIEARNAGRPVADGDIVPACAQTCPTRAIVFGDLNDPESKVSRLQAQQRSYKLLEELNVKPRTAYLARIRNPNPVIAGNLPGQRAGHGHETTGTAGGGHSAGEQDDHGGDGAHDSGHQADDLH